MPLLVGSYFAMHPWFSMNVHSRNAIDIWCSSKHSSKHGTISLANQVLLEVIQWWKICEYVNLIDLGGPILIFIIFYHIWYDDTLWHHFSHFWTCGLISLNQSNWFLFSNISIHVNQSKTIHFVLGNKVKPQMTLPEISAFICISTYACLRSILWKITKIFKGITGGQDTMLWTPINIVLWTPLNIVFLFILVWKEKWWLGT